MPSKRQPSKQRRAAQNRAQRAAREARRERAGELSAAAETRSESQETSSGTSGSTGRSAGGFLSNLLGGGGGRSGRTSGSGSSSSSAPAGSPLPAPSNAKVIGGGMVALDTEGKPLPGARAAFVAVVLAIVGALAMIFLPINEVDDRGDAVPAAGQFRGLYIEVRELLNPGAAPLETENVTLMELLGPAVVLYALVPVAIVIGAYWMHRRMGRSLPLTVGMLVLAVMFMLLGGLGAGMFFIPALIGLAIGSFQARRVELPARMAERAARRGGAQPDETSDDDDDYEDEDLVDDDDYEDEDETVDDEDFSIEDDEEADEEEAEEEGYGFASDKRK